MSVSDMNVSWSTMSTRRTLGSTNPSSVFLTSSKRNGSAVPHVQRPKCVSAKHSGMRFQGWREPKPLRSRCNSAIVADEMEKPKSEKSKSTNKLQREDTSIRKETVDRLTQPTTASKWKSSQARPRDVGVDMNFYSWSKMNVYKDYQRVLYKANGTMKPSVRGKER